MAEDGSTSYYYPNRLGRALLRQIEYRVGLEAWLEVLKISRLSDLANLYPPSDVEREFPFEVVSVLQGAVENVFGVEEGRQINREVGRALLDGGLIDFDPLLGIADLPERVLPIGMKLRVGLDTFADVFNRYSDQVVRLGEVEHHYLWAIERCPVCWGRQTDSPCCHLAVGILEQGLTWTTAGAQFAVEESACIAAGAPTCTLRVSKTPLD
jgi:predicted hydrocarbon binding protein